MGPASNSLLGRVQRSKDGASLRFGPNTAEVVAFVEAVARLTPSQWRQVLAARQLVASVTKEGAGQGAQAIQAAISGGEPMSEPMSSAGQVLFDALAKKSEEKQVAAWQAMSALVTRHHLPALKFAAHYAPFSVVIPVSGSDVLDPMTRRFMVALEALSAGQIESLAHKWRIEPAASRALLQAVAKHSDVKGEESVAMAALTLIPAHVTGDSGWAAVRTAVHGGRVLGCMADLTQQEVAELWAPLEAAIPLASLTEDQKPASARGKAIKPPRSRVPVPAPATTATPYGPNSAEVATFIKGVPELTPIKWLRVLDRRKLVVSATGDSSAEPSAAVRSMLAAIKGTQELDMFTRCRAFAAVERAGYAVESHGRMNSDQVTQMYAPFAHSIPLDDVKGAGFAHHLASLSKHDWEKVAAAAPAANEEAVAPLVNAGTALIDFFGRRSDDEAVAAWHAVSALVRRHHLTPIKFAASYAPFASAIPVTNPRTLGAMVSRYVTAVGRIGVSQSAVLARQWSVDEDASRALSKSTADGSARPAEEAAALAAVVTVPMRMAGSVGWAAVKTAAFGGRVIASRARLTPEQLEALWKPIEPAIPLASLGAPAKPKREASRNPPPGASRRPPRRTGR
ncbi:MAG TPA: hypothetical protein VHJ99_02200 [Candidatus Dormibacteraeota bacterium]|nr:hypothetical protein [Candidatus Dormibacteraeota bacterium]